MRNAPATAPPELTPQKMPSRTAMTHGILGILLMNIQHRIHQRSVKIPGIYSAGQRRIPGILLPSSGCRPTMVTGLLCSRRKRDTPVMVPVVPILETKWVIRPAVCCQISGPVVV